MNIHIIHHTDADGHCAAALVRYELTNPTNKVSYYAYNYMGDIETEVTPNSFVYLVDISMSEFVEKFIKNALTQMCTVVHIDHHKPSVDYYNEHQIDEPKWVHFVQDETDERNGPISGSLLTFIYTCMNSDQKMHPMDVEFDLTDLRDHMIFNGNTDMEYRIPFIVRLVDDHDVWRHKLTEAKAFSYAYKRMPKELIDPENDDLWESIYNDNNRLLFTSIRDGERYIQDEDERNAILRNIGGFETDLFGNNCYAMNNLTAGSDQFAEEYETRDMVCRFAYNGKGWTYSLYSSNPEIDCSEIAKQYGGGGHRGAAGFKLDHCIFGVPKRTFFQKLKDLFKK